MTAVDILKFHPTDCADCSPLPQRRACLAHTCPDCGLITSGEKNEAGELTHRCCTYCSDCIARGEKYFPNHWPSMGCRSGKRPHCTCDGCW